MQENALTGTIPPALGTLPELKELFLQNNRLHGPLPLSLAMLPKLTALGVGGNELTGEISGPFGEWLGQLEWISMAGGNQFTGSLP